MRTVQDHADSDLVDLARSGDEEAFGELWRRHAAAGRAVAHSFSDADPDDLVAEAYARILATIRAGGGPTTGFRPYLFTAIRNLAASWGRARHEVTLEDAAVIEDPATSEAASMDALDRSLTAQAFRSLPERWQEVLWYCEVERMTAAAVGPLLGLSANGVSALAYRAREGLRQAWIQAHLTASPEGSECRWTTERLGAYSRDGLGKRETARVDRHLAECAKCSIVAAEAGRVGSHLAMVLLPLLLGIGGASAYAATLAHTGGSVAAGAASGGAGGSSSGSGSGSSSGSGSTAGTSSATSGAAGSGSGVAVGVTVAGVALAAAVAVGAVVLGPQLFSSRPPVASVAGAESSEGAAPANPTSPSSPAPATHDPSVPPAVPPTAPAPARPGENAAAPTSPSTPAADPDATTPATPTPAGPTIPSTPSTPATPTTPDAPVVTTPLSPDFTTADDTLPLSGTGVPGALITLTAEQLADPSPLLLRVSAATTAPARPLGTATVAADGRWTVEADLSALPDGRWVLALTQTTPAGTSALATLTVTIDRTPAAPTVLTVDTGEGALAGLLAPVLTGTAKPGATVDLFDDGRPIATVTADSSGAWTSPELIAVSPAYSLTVRQTDAQGRVSADSTPVSGEAVVATVAATGSPNTVTIAVDGIPGARAQVWADGRTTPYTLTLDAAGKPGATYGWSPGDHRIGVVYLFGDRHGVLGDVPVTLP